jgi:hypothetical protein
MTAIACLALTAVACGGSGTAKLYAKGPTSACLVKQGFHPKPVSNSADFVANSATGGAFQVKLADNSVTVSFGLTDGDAQNIEDAYRTFKASNVGIEDVLRAQGNAVMLWHVHPTDSDLGTVTGCLKS